MSQQKKSAGRRLSIVTVDQAIAGASNVLAAVLAARTLGVAEFGLFGIVFIVYVTAQGAARALVCEPLLVHPREAEDRPQDAIGTAVVLGLGVGALVAASGLAAWPWYAGLGHSLLVLGACMPLLVLQDLGRYLGFATHRPVFSLVLDLVWLVLVVAAVTVLIAVDEASLVLFITAWAGSGAVAGLLVLVRHGFRALRPSLLWLRETWAFSWRYLLSFTAMQGAALVTSVGVAAVAGVRDLGAVRGALLLTRPVGLVQIASVAAGTAEVSRLEPGSAEVRRHVNRTTGLTTVVALANMAVLLTLPDSLGRMVLGDTWEPTKELLLPATVQILMLGLICGTRAGLTGMRAVQKTVRLDVGGTVVVSGATVLGAVVSGALGAYWALTMGQAVVAVLWWTVYLRHLRHLRGRSSVGPTSGDGLRAGSTTATGR